MECRDFTCYKVANPHDILQSRGSFVWYYLCIWKGYSNEQRDLWHDLRYLAPTMVDQFWFVIGDFNEITNTYP